MKMLTHAVLFFVLLLTIGYGRAQQVTVYTSSSDLLLKQQKTTAVFTRATNRKATLIVNEKERYQAILGFGGTYSEATAYNLKRISPQKRKEVLEAFFHPVKGAGWTMLRTTINSCDASSSYYSYCETAGDSLLQTFSIQKDIDNYMIPGLQQIQLLQPALKIFASPWTPPVWMKDSKVFNKGSLLTEHYTSWSRYFSKYITAYKKNGIAIWAVTPQNEPEAFEQKWDACGWTPGNMNLFVKNHLGPQLKKDHPGVQLIAWDHNKNHLLQWCDILLGDPVTRKYFSAIAHHWYDGGEAAQFEILQAAQKKYPAYPLLATEQGVFGLYLQQPEPAELYAKDIIGNMNNGSAAWVVWGMAFDHKGGPNHAANFNHSPIMIEVEKNQLYYNASYYYIAHFSKFVKPGAVRIGIVNNNAAVLATAFLNKNGKKVVVVLNTADKNELLILKDENKQLSHTIAAKTIVSLVY